jgi:MSHA biogenesis protein MshM
MYLAHFGLNQPPFSITPNPAFFYDGSSRGAILEALLYAVIHGEGIIKVTGEVGSGKTMLCRMLECLLPENVEVIYLVNPTLRRDEVLYAIAGELGLAVDGKRADEVIRLLQNDLIAKHAEGKQVVLLVEEAQAMPLDTLEEIRLFSNLETAHHKLLQIVLFGQPELDENLALPRMRQLKERITHSFPVPPLNSDSLPEFLMFRMRAAGYRGANVFTGRALKLIGDVSGGIVRRISILADKSLLAAFSENSPTVEAQHVEAAISDSEFSNMPATSRRRGLAIMLTAVLVVALVAAIAYYAGAAREHGAIQSGIPYLPPVPTKAVPAPAVQVQPGAGQVLTAASTPAVPAGDADATIAALLEQSRQWASSENPRNYAVQIQVLPADAARLQQFLQGAAGLLDRRAIHVFPTREGPKPAFGVVYGSYAARPQAAEMRRRLAARSDFRLKMRTVEGINEEIKRTNSAGGWALHQ